MKSSCILSAVSQRSLSGLLAVSQWYLSGISAVSQWSLSGLSAVSQQSLGSHLFLIKPSEPKILRLVSNMINITPECLVKGIGMDLHRPHEYFFICVIICVSMMRMRNQVQVQVKSTEYKKDPCCCQEIFGSCISPGPG